MLLPTQQKRLESLTEAEIEALLEQVEEEKRQSADGEKFSCTKPGVCFLVLFLYRVFCIHHVSGHTSCIFEYLIYM